MPRQPRLDLPGIPQHVVQRGNDRQPCFFEETDYLRYLQELKELALRRHCAVHAYVLMTNHVHLLLTPTDSGQMAALMQAPISTIATIAPGRYGMDATRRVPRTARAIVAWTPIRL